MSIDHSSAAVTLRVRLQAGSGRGHVSAFLFAALLGTASCGGGTQAASKTADSAEDAAQTEESAQEADEEADAEEPARATCDDGTCSTCGKGICPTGWYCDQNAKGGPACGWIPECVKKPSCACLKKALGAKCECEEREGAVSVSCN